MKKRVKQMKVNKRVNEKKIKTKRNKENSKYFDKSVIRTINNVFISSEWCGCVVSFHSKELKELSSNLVVNEDEADVGEDDSYGNIMFIIAVKEQTS